MCVFVCVMWGAGGGGRESIVRARQQAWIQKEDKN